MALNKKIMGTAMANAVRAAASADPQNQQAMMEALAGAIIDHFKTFAEVDTVVTTAVSTVGTAAAQAGTGTGTGKGIPGTAIK